MIIQSSVNQGLSLMGFMLSQSPLAETRKEAAKEKAETKRIGRQYEEAKGITESTLTAAGDLESLATEEERETAIAMHTQALEEESRLAEELFRRNPTEENLSQAIRTRTATTDYGEAIAEDREERASARRTRQQEAEDSAREALETTQRTQTIYNEITRPFDPSRDNFRW